MLPQVNNPGDRCQVLEALTGIALIPNLTYRDVAVPSAIALGLSLT